MHHRRARHARIGHAIRAAHAHAAGAPGPHRVGDLAAGGERGLLERPAPAIDLDHVRPVRGNRVGEVGQRGLDVLGARALAGVRRVHQHRVGRQELRAPRRAGLLLLHEVGPRAVLLAVEARGDGQPAGVEIDQQLEIRDRAQVARQRLDAAQRERGLRIVGRAAQVGDAREVSEDRVELRPERRVQIVHAHVHQHRRVLPLHHLRREQPRGRLQQILPPRDHRVAGGEAHVNGALLRRHHEAPRFGLELGAARDQRLLHSVAAEHRHHRHVRTHVAARQQRRVQQADRRRPLPIDRRREGGVESDHPRELRAQRERVLRHARRELLHHALSVRDHQVPHQLARHLGTGRQRDLDRDRLAGRRDLGVARE